MKLRPNSQSLGGCRFKCPQSQPLNGSQGLPDVPHSCPRFPTTTHPCKGSPTTLSTQPGHSQHPHQSQQSNHPPLPTEDEEASRSKTKSQETTRTFGCHDESTAQEKSQLIAPGAEDEKEGSTDG